MSLADENLLEVTNKKLQYSFKVVGVLQQRPLTPHTTLGCDRALSDINTLSTYNVKTRKLQAVRVVCVAQRCIWWCSVCVA